MKPLAFDLFAGCGGLTTGIKQAGYAVVGALEIDALAAESFRLNHPEVLVWEEDVRDVDAAAVRKVLGLRRGELDLLAGCPPCQGFSDLRTRRKRPSVRDPRNSLASHFFRFVEAFRPKALMMENVPGLARDRIFTSLVRRLTEIGYRCSHDILDAADYGVPQRRRRLILIAGYRKDLQLARPALSRRTVRDTIGNVPASDDRLQNEFGRNDPKVKRLIRLVPVDGGSRKDIPTRFRLRCHQRSDGFSDVYGRMAWDNVAPTITSGCINPSKGRFLHPEEHRAITLREAALLQSFPPDYQFSLRRGRYAVAEQIGNALPPEFIRRNAIALKKSLLQS